MRNQRSIEHRISLTEDNNLSFRLYLKLAFDKHPDVRFSLASNANIPKFILKRLAEDENVFVAHRAQKTIDRIDKEFQKEIAQVSNRRPQVYNLGRGQMNV